MQIINRDMQVPILQYFANRFRFMYIRDEEQCCKSCSLEVEHIKFSRIKNWNAKLF